MSCRTYMEKRDLREIRKQKFAEMEERLKELHPKEEDSMFYYHPSEDRIVLSHAMFWTMTQLQFLRGKIRKQKFFLLILNTRRKCLMLTFRTPMISPLCCINVTSSMSICP